RLAPCRRAHGCCDAHRRPLAGCQVAPGGELTVGLDDDAPRDAELARETARGRQAHAGREPSAADALAQRVLELLVQGQAAGAVEFHEYFGALSWSCSLSHYWNCIPSQSCPRVAD